MGLVHWARIALSVLLFGATGCADHHLRIPEDGITDLDVLLVVDDSGGMRDEQALFVDALPGLLRGLSRGGIGPELRFAPISSIRVGVVSSDMGSGGNPVVACSEPTRGEDGVLRTEGDTTRRGCEESYPSWAQYQAGDSLDGFIDHVSCVASIEEYGCGYEQPLEATLKALTTRDSTFEFFPSDTGHADGANAGFLRRDAAKLIIILSDEDDCSSDEPERFFFTSSSDAAALNARCAQNPERMRDVTRYVEGLRDVAPADQLFFAVIAGIPTEHTGEPNAADLERLLRDPRMEIRVGMDDLLVPSCQHGASGKASPPVRLVKTAEQIQQIGARVHLGSVCQGSYDSVVDGILALFEYR